MDNFGVFGHVHFFHEAGSVGTDGLDAERHLLGKVGNAFTGANAAKKPGTRDRSACYAAVFPGSDSIPRSVFRSSPG